MARKKQQKKRLKKYKGKYVTADRLDMSKGGRVSYRRGGPRKEETEPRISTKNVPTPKSKVPPKKEPVKVPPKKAR